MFQFDDELTNICVMIMFILIGFAGIFVLGFLAPKLINGSW